MRLENLVPSSLPFLRALILNHTLSFSRGRNDSVSSLTFRIDGPSIRSRLVLCTGTTFPVLWADHFRSSTLRDVALAYRTEGRQSFGSRSAPAIPRLHACMEVATLDYNSSLIRSVHDVVNNVTLPPILWFLEIKPWLKTISNQSRLHR